jgi:hypothetical protein
MNTLAEALRTELQDLEILLHRLTTLRLVLATGTQRSIERAAVELDEALWALGDAESARTEALRRSGHTSMVAAIAECEEPVRSDLTLTRSRLERTHNEVLGAATATSAMASRSLAHIQDALRDLGAVRGVESSPWQSYGPHSVAASQAHASLVDGRL